MPMLTCISVEIDTQTLDAISKFKKWGPQLQHQYIPP